MILTRQYIIVNMPQNAIIPPPQRKEPPKTKIGLVTIKLTNK